MDREGLLSAIKSAKEYSGICDETILRVIDGVIPRYKSDKLIIKSVKSTLREISAAFLTSKELKKATEIVAGINWDDKSSVLSKTGEILGLHQSTRERAGHFVQLLGDIYEVTGFNSVLDIGCGLCPFIIPHADCMREVEYTGLDIHMGAVSLANTLLQGLGIKGHAFAGDILTQTPDVGADCVFMFKLLPLLRLGREASELLRGLHCRHIALTFPTRSMSGRNVGMKGAYEAFVRSMEGLPVIYEKEYPNELLYVLEAQRVTS